MLPAAAIGYSPQYVISNVGADTPANVLSAYAASNVGYQSAPLSCATELPQDLPLPDAGAPPDDGGAP